MWKYELVVVTIILAITTFIFANDFINWLTTLAVLFTFQHAQIGDRLQEQQRTLDRPTVECYRKLAWYFGIKEILWVIVFLMLHNYAAIVGAVLFTLYPLWRAFYRKKISPLPSRKTLSEQLDDLMKIPLEERKQGLSKLNTELKNSPK